MTNTKSTKRALLSSVLALFLCFSMLLGTTFAWFTDSVTSANNVIQSGNLDIELEYATFNDDGTFKTWVDVKDAADILTNTLWEPGVTEVAYLRVANAGSLALKYQLGINIESETAGTNAEGNSFKLSNYIKFGVVEGVNGSATTYATREDAVAAVTDSKIISAGFTKAEAMQSGDELYLALVVWMPTDVSNDANYKTSDDPTDPDKYRPTINLGINIFATQMTSEYDSFGNDYDAEAGGVFELTYGFNNAKDLLAFAPTSGDAASSGLRIENGKAIVEDSGAWFTADTNLALKETTISYTLDITDLDDGKHIMVDTGDQATWNSTPILIERGSAKVYYGTAKNEYLGTLEGTKLTVTHTYSKNDEGKLVIATVVSDGEDAITFEKSFTAENKVTLYWDIYSATQSGVVTMDNFTLVHKMAEIKTGEQLAALFEDVKDGGTLTMPQSFNSSSAPLEEAIAIEGELTVNPNGMYLVSSAPETFTVAEGGKLTVTDGSFTIKNTASNGAAVVVDGGEFVMAGGSFDAHTAVRTTEGKSSTVTLAAGWSNRVTVAFDSKGDDTINITGGTIYSSAESIKTTAGTKVTINMSGGTLSGKPARQNQYNPSIVCNAETVINMTGGKIETTANQSIAVNILENSEINLSGDAVISGTNAGIRVGDFSGRNPGDNCEINISGNAKVTANGAGNNWKIGFAIQANATNTTINISGNARVEGSSYGVNAGQDGCVITISDSAYIKAFGGSEGYGVGAPTIIMTGGTIEAKNYGLISDIANSKVVIDNSATGTPIAISGGTYDVYVHATTDYTVGGDPVFDTFGTRS